MTWTKERLLSEFNLTDEELTKTLKVSGLPLEQDEYSDEDIESKFKVVRGYFDSNRTDTYTGAADLFQQEFGIIQPTSPQPEPDIQPKAKKSRNGKKPPEVMGFSEMCNWVSETIKTRVSWKEAGEILLCCGLPDQEKYSSAEAERFLSACDLYKNQAKTKEQIAAHFKVDSASGPDSNNLKQAALRLAEQIDETASAAKAGFSRLVDLAVEKQTADISKEVNGSFLKKAYSELESGRIELELFYAEVEERMKTQIEGKNQVHSLGATWEWAANSLPPSSPKPMSLPEGSENGTLDE